MNTACPPDGELERLLANQLEQIEELALETHVVDCEKCQRRLNELTQFAGTIPPNSAQYLNCSERPPSGVLARLANSSKPVVRVVEANGTEKDSRIESAWRRFGASQSILASRRFLRRQIWTWPLIAAVLLGCLGWWVNRSVESAMRQQLISELKTFLDADAEALRVWMDSQRISAELVADDERLAPMVQELLPISNAPDAFDRNGLLLSQSRFDDQLKQVGLLVDRPDSRSILSVDLRDPGVNMLTGNRPSTPPEDRRLTRMAASAVKGFVGYDTNGYRDYRGVEVVGAWKWLNHYDFGIATEIDKDEAFAPVAILRRVFAVLMGLLTAAAVGIFLAMLSIARRERQLLDATLAAQQFGQYTLVEKLGSGGMGTVYKARHALLRRPTAVKLLNPDSISDTAIARFEREVQLTSGLTHPNTVAVYDYGRTADGVFYYAMEYLEGVNLDELVRRHGPLMEERVLYILRQVCASLGEAHAAGLIHRDVKPANILLTVRGGQHDFVKVLDFGLAKPVFHHVDSDLTAPDTLAGTPLYVSPEAIISPERIDARADVYAIAAVGYYLLTGSPVFNGSSAADICLKHVNEIPVSPAKRRGQPVNATLEAILLRCLAKSPLDRPENGTDLLSHLEKCVGSSSWTPADAARWWADRNQMRTATNASVSVDRLQSSLKSMSVHAAVHQPQGASPGSYP